jgi:hypothetical protein
VIRVTVSQGFLTAAADAVSAALAQMPDGREATELQQRIQLALHDQELKTGQEALARGRPRCRALGT